MQPPQTIAAATTNTMHEHLAMSAQGYRWKVGVIEMGWSQKVTELLARGGWGALAEVFQQSIDGDRQLLLRQIRPLGNRGPSRFDQIVSDGGHLPQGIHIPGVR
jgi:hypothetical protein